jgi:hypothetical protein
MTKRTYILVAVCASYFVIVDFLFAPLGPFETEVRLQFLRQDLAALLVLTLIAGVVLLILKRKKIALRLVGLAFLFSSITYFTGVLHYHRLLTPEELMHFGDTRLIPALDNCIKKHGEYPDESPIWLPQGIDYCGRDANYLIHVRADGGSDGVFLGGWTSFGVPGDWDYYD